MIATPPRAREPHSLEMLLDLAPELEALPSVANRVLSVLREGRASPDNLASLLETDQALASAVLRHANSALAMPNRRIASLRDAVARVGQRQLSIVVVRASAGPMLDRGLPPYALPRRVAWRHAATTSLAARSLADRLRVGNPDEAGVAGLLHDLGKMVLSSVVPELAAEAVSIARGQRVPVWQAEQHVVGFDHGAVGGALLRRWGLPESVACAVEFSHRPELPREPLARLVSLADAAAHAVGAVGSGGACPQPRWDPASASAIGADPVDLESFVDSLRCVDESDL